MSEKFIKPEKSIWKLQDGTIWEGPVSELPKANADLIAKAGWEYPESFLKEHGWGKKAPAKKAPAKKEAPKKKVETKAVKPSDNK
tara:strand:+ start:718 stop:972 length:255 start_codon:yes stop_codon:yes gene_type:complete